MGQRSARIILGVVFVTALILLVAAIYLLATEPPYEEPIERTTGSKGMVLDEDCSCVDPALHNKSPLQRNYKLCTKITNGC
jgi:hypothetical protein